MEQLIQLSVAVGMGIFVANLFCCVEETKEVARERRRVERSIAEKYPPVY